VFCVSVKVKLTVPLLCLCVHSVWKGRPRNDLHCVGWDAKPYSLTHSLLWFVSLRCEPINYPLPRSRLLVAKVTVKVKGPCPRGGGLGGAIISHTLAVEPVGEYATESVTHGQCGYLPILGALPPFDRYQIILLGEQRHRCVNNSPKVVTWQCSRSLFRHSTVTPEARDRLFYM